jgi:hypothetical protein
MAKRVRVEYAGEGLESYLPRSGTLKRELLDSTGNPGWFLLELDQPLEYQLKVEEPFQFRLLRVEHFLVRSRWTDCPIGSAKPTSVFVLLVEDSQIPVPNPVDVKHYHHVGWGTCVIDR